jgi:hypothetical protein
VSRYAWAIIASAIAADVAITFFLIAVPMVTVHSPLSKNLLLLLQWDASNAYGAAAFSGGWAMAAMGQLFDIIVSIAWATFFLALWLRMPALRLHTWAWGLAYGAIVMVVMLYGLVPLGHAARMHDSASNIVRVLIAHTVFFGLPLSLVLDAAGKKAIL